MNHITHINRKRELGKQLKLLVDYMPCYDSLEELEKLNLEILCITQEIKEIERLPKAVQYSLTYFKKTILKSKMNEDRNETVKRYGNDDCLTASQDLRNAEIRQYAPECL